MPRAIEYGMPLDLFWHGEMTLISAYEKAYIRRTSLLAYHTANYMKTAFELAQGNVWSGKKGKYHEMPKYQDPIKKSAVLTKENLEIKHRNLMADNMEFLMRKDRKINGEIFSRNS